MNTDTQDDGSYIGIIGLGSIGRKHLSYLSQIGLNKFIALRSQKGSLKDSPKGDFVVKEVYNEKDFFNYKLKGVLICNPTSLHLDAINSCLENKVKMFVEKPLFSDLKQAKKLVQHPEKEMIVGFCLRFHPIIKKVKGLLDEKVLGTIHYSNFEVGQYLPDWHPYTDYQREYFSRSELGGGALRTLSHEIDLLNYFFKGKPNLEVKTFKLSNLKIDVDDYAKISGFIDEMKVEVSMDFISRKHKRRGSIIGEHGEIHYDFFSGELCVYQNNGEVMEILYEEEDLYSSQMKDFINFLESGDTSACSFEEAMECMKIIDLEVKTK